MPDSQPRWQDLGVITKDEIDALDLLLNHFQTLATNTLAEPKIAEFHEKLAPLIERWARLQDEADRDAHKSAVRFASHDDDPQASLADRLLLALGMWPSYVDQLGAEALIEAAVQIRGDAHRFPMAAEDYGAKANDYEELADALRMAIANDTPVSVDEARRLLDLE